MSQQFIDYFISLLSAANEKISKQKSETNEDITNYNWKSIY